MGNTTNYFREKKPWSIFKDALLKNYLPQYLAKLGKKRHDIYIIDCFAGKGRFDDGSKGSPIIIAEAVRKALKKHPRPRIKAVFIEKKHALDLQKNLAEYPSCEVISGKFQDHFDQFRGICRRASVLLYIDPYGIRDLDSLFFKDLVVLSRQSQTSLEMLLNLNTLGFLREGCRLLKPYMDLSVFDDLDADYEGEIESIDRMGRIVGGTFWEQLVSDYYHGKITFSQLESRFTQDYLKQLSTEVGLKGFTHVLNTPIKAKERNVPKYRMIFGTNHMDGAILMANNMNNRWNKFLEQDRDGQMLLFDMLRTTEGQELTENDIDCEIMRLLCTQQETRFEEALVAVWGRFGIAVSGKQIKERVLDLRARGELTIAWDPPTTRTGREPRSLDTKHHKVILQKGNPTEQRKPDGQMKLFDKIGNE